MNTPDRCRNMTDVRAGIDSLDREIVRLLGERAGYVRAAAKFKTDSASVKAEDRQKAMLAVRREWAEEEDLDPDFVESLYRLVVSHFVQSEMRDWESCR